MNGHEPMPSLRAWAEAKLGPCAWHPRSWGHRASQVFRLEHAGGAAFCKLYREGRKFLQERRALRDWTSSLPGTPRILASRSGRAPALLLSAVPGMVMLEQVLPAEDEAGLHRQAGAWLARLHAVPHADRDPLPLAVAIVRRAEAWFARAEGLVAAELLDWARGQVGRLDHGVPIPRVPCHRDFSPRNWLIARGADGRWQLGIIDFEHSRPDCWLQDLDRLEGHWWPGREDLRDAFLAGYGRAPSAAEREVANVLAVINAVSTVAWGREHEDRQFESEGRARLLRLREG